MLLEVVLLYLVRSFFRGLPFNAALVLPLSALASLVLWTSIPWLLLDRRLQWRRLLPGGVLAGVAVALYGVATGVYMPRLMETYSDRYGLFGVTIALVGWLLCISVIVVSATVTAAELDRAGEGWAVWLRARLGLTTNRTLVTYDPTHRHGSGDGRPARF
jgi:membrane protein